MEVGISEEHAIPFPTGAVLCLDGLGCLGNTELFLSQEAWPFWASEETLSHPGLSCLPVLLGMGSFK